MFEYFDIHSHLYFSGFDVDREEEIRKLKDSRIGTMTIGTDFPSSVQSIELAEKHENLFATIGEHPGDLTLESIFDARLESLATHKKVVAIGEFGLDYFRLTENFDQIKTVQKKIFQSHVDLALQVDKPLMLHIRPSKGTQDAYMDALEMLENQKKISGEKLRGNVHFFVGDMDTLKRFLGLGFTVSFTGVITFTHDYDEIVRAVPLNMIMSETDAPLVPPVPYRGQRNSPLYVPEVVKRIAELRNEPLEDVKKALCNNAERYFLGVA